MLLHVTVTLDIVHQRAKMSTLLKLVWFMLSVLCLVQITESSLFEPHLFPKEGPFFEGWYLRITDFSKHDSIGLLFGSVLPESGTNVTGPLVFASILRRNCTSGDACRLVAINGAFETKDLDIAVQGRNVSKDPDVTSPADFRWQVDNGEHGGYLYQGGNDTYVNFQLGEIALIMKTTQPYPWNRDGYGPEGWLVMLPLPLHWFVFSLRSKLVYYELQNRTSGAVLRGENGVVHMEKNWGRSFPKKWIWSEGVIDDGTNASYAISGGLVDLLGISVDAYLIGYRNPSNGLELSFRPTNSLVSVQIDGCSGSVNLTINSLSYRVEIMLKGTNTSFSTCLYGPEVNGFQRACVESYDATAYFEITERTFFPYGYKTVNKQTFQNVGLEFGGTNVCGNACTGQ